MARGRMYRFAMPFICAALIPLAAFAADPLRLDPNVAPTFETITLHIDADRPDYTGSVRIELAVKKATNTFRFHAQDLTMTDVRLSGAGGDIRLTHTAGKTGLITAATETPLQPGQYTLDIAFSNRFNTQAVSLYRVEAGGHAYAFTQFEAWDARKAFPCWDEPSFKIPYRMTLVVPEAHLAISNTPVQSESVENGRRTVVFERTRPLPSYLLAVATGPFDTVPIPGLAVPGRVVTTKGNAHLAQEAATMTAPLLKALEGYFGRPYPYEKLDLIGVPEFQFGAMENAGAITFRDNFLLMDSATTNMGQRRSLAGILAHELAHHWFGNLVTMAWWDDVWLNESFADWLCTKIVDEVYPAYKSSVEEIRATQHIMTEDTRLSSRAMRKPVSPADNQNDLFDLLAYDKGQAVLGMIEHWIGPDTFREGVRAYLKTHEWGNATAGDLWTALSRASGKNLNPLMASFLNQPGVPLVRVEPLPDGRVRLRQERFLNEGVKAPAPGRWEIPVMLRYPDGQTVRTQTVLLTQPAQTVRLQVRQPPAWIHPNAGEYGYYRWTVPPATLLAMAEHAAEWFDVRERMGLIGHLTALLDAGLLKGDTYLQALSAFADDPEPNVLTALGDGLYKVLADFIEETPALREPFERYIRITLTPVLDRFGLARRPGEEETVSLVRSGLIWWLGIHGNDPRIQAFADSLMDAYFQDPASVDPALVATAFQVSAARGDRVRFELYRLKFATTPVPVERARFLGALAYFRDPRLVDAALDYVLEGPLRPHEVMTIPFGLHANAPQHRDRLLEWMSARYGQLTARIPTEEGAYFPWLANGASLTRLETARAFFADPAHAPAGTEDEVRKVEEEVRRRLRLREREGRAVEEYLKGRAVQ